MEEPGQTSQKLDVRTVFISDLHLGTRHAQTDLLLDFLKKVETKKIYLVGDIIDNWALRRRWHWKQSHNDVVQKLLRKARKGVPIVYIPGNHDEQFRSFTSQAFGNVTVRKQDIHTAADGRRYLVLHGDQFDGVVLYAKWLAHLGDKAYAAALQLNLGFNFLRRKIGLPYWSLSAYLKRRVKRAVELIGNFEQAVVREAREHDVDGVVCGHIHTAEFRMIDGIQYCNDGDWVESCTALVEHHDGRMELLDWARVSRLHSEKIIEFPDRHGRLGAAS